MTTSYGLLPWRLGPHGEPEVFLVHPGGPFWRHRERGAWSIPKGLPEAGETPQRTARREFSEETGLPLPEAPWHPLAPVRLRGGKQVTAWAVQAPDLDPAAVVSNTFEMEWPPHSGRRTAFPEIDRAGWFSLTQARHLANPAYAPWFDEIAKLARRHGEAPAKNGGLD